jgi:RNA polymerase sigma-70 factor (sigma-E family)
LPREGNPVARRNDDQFVEYVVGNQARLRRTAYLLCGDWQRAADITQEALIRVYLAWPRIERKGGLPTYVRRTIVSVAIDLQRKRSSRELPTVGNDSAPAEIDIERSVSDRAALLAALATLPPRQRACVVLRYYDDLSVREVAHLLECSEGTVKSQTSRALDTLQRTFAAQQRDELLLPDGDAESTPHGSGRTS